MGVGPVVVVADSTSALPAQQVADLGIVVVPVHVVIDDKSLREGIDITPAEVADQLRSGVRLTTSRPSPAEFLAAYQEAADHGAQAIVSVHLSAQLSGTFQSAQIAAKTSPIPVRVVDTRTIALAAGYAAMDAALIAARGGTAEEAARAAKATAGHSEAYFYVDTLEYLRRGGRIGAAQRYLGQALRVKPLLGMSGGAVAPLEKVRTSARGLARLAELAAQQAGSLERPRLGVHHLQAQASADLVLADLRSRLPEAPCLESEIGAVIGVHTGPGMVAVVVAPGAPA